LRLPGEIAQQFGLERCSVCGGWLVNVRTDDLLPEERTLLDRLGIATVATRYQRRAVCSREKAQTGICVEH
jgi:hypothetical protein